MTAPRDQILTALVSGALLLACSPPYEFRHQSFDRVKTRPDVASVIGTYVMCDQTIIRGGLIPLHGRTCTIELRPDKTFSASNYPDFAQLRPDAPTDFPTFHDIRGEWELDSIGFDYGYSHAGKQIWGIRFLSSPHSIDPTDIIIDGTSLALLTEIGDPDSGAYFRFTKAK